MPAAEGEELTLPVQRQASEKQEYHSDGSGKYSHDVNRQRVVPPEMNNEGKEHRDKQSDQNRNRLHDHVCRKRHPVFEPLLHVSLSLKLSHARSALALATGRAFS